MFRWVAFGVKPAIQIGTKKIETNASQLIDFRSNPNIYSMIKYSIFDPFYPKCVSPRKAKHTDSNMASKKVLAQH